MEEEEPKNEEEMSSDISRDEGNGLRVEDFDSVADYEYEKKRRKKRELAARTMANRPAWQDVTVKHSKAPHDLTVTHVNQTRDLLRARGVDAADAEAQTSEEWLQNHSMDEMKLTLKDLVAKGRVGKPVHKDGQVRQQLHFDAATINEFEYKCHMCIEMFTKRIKWLLNGSKRVFGLVKGTKVAVCIDSSDANCGFGRLSAFQESLLHLIDEQLSQKKKLYLMSFGTDTKSLWNAVREVNVRTVEEAKGFVMGLQAGGGCNLLKGMKHVMKLKDINSICLILGSVPDQSSDILCDYVHQMGVGKEMPLHTVAYDCSNHLTNITLRNLAETSEGRYQCYSSASEDQIYSGTDISSLLKEIKKAQDVINRIKEMRQGLMGTALVSIENEIVEEVAKLPTSRFLPRPPGHLNPLQIEEPKFQPKSSADWLLSNGLKAKHLDLYQVLAPNAYTYKEEFIPVIRRTVQSQVYGKAMAQFKWHDGSIRNVHVDMSHMFEYQKHLASTVELYEQRIAWLSSASRRIFGTIVEKNVVILVDTSICNTNYLVHIQHSLRLLLEQQMLNKEYFNIICFGSTVQKWKPTMMKPTEENLQSAWRFVLDMQCSGSRNFLGAIRAAVQNDEEAKHNINVEGLYLFTSGIPDQPEEVTIAFVEESVAGRNLKLHTVLFNVDDYDCEGAIPGRYANITTTANCLRTLAHCSHGRFHWFRETGVIESDDVKAVSLEIDKAVNFSQKCAMLVGTVKKKYKKEQLNYSFEELKALPSPDRKLPKALPPPKQTTLSLARMEISSKDKDENGELKTLAWRPSSAKTREEIIANAKPRVYDVFERPKSAKNPMQKVKSTYKKTATQTFYTDDKNNVGTVFRKYPGSKSVRKEIRTPLLPEKEDILTSKDWLRLYGLNKLKLDLTKLVAGPDCKHVEKPVKTLHKNVTAKYCDIFPSINVKGTIKHLQLLPHELKEYEVQAGRVLKRYLKRLQWLLNGSRRVFGTVVHKQCAFLIDISGSMAPFMAELKKELASLVWEQLHKLGARFNLIAFSGGCVKWRETITECLEQNAHDAIKWVSHLKAEGNTCTLDALELAFDDPDVEAIYLLTDGKPDTSTSLVLREVARMNSERHIEVNTISFNCEDSTANNFLKLLAQETGGRYHRCHSEFDADLFAHKLLDEGFHDEQYPHLPEFDGDDLRRLGAEIAQVRRYISQSRSYRALFPDEQKMSAAEIKQNGKIAPPPFIP